jgi:hypothetical protein
VESEEGMEVKEPDPGRAPLMEETQRSRELMETAWMVLACRELVRREKVERVEGMEVREPEPGRAPLIEETQRSRELMVPAWIVLAVILPVDIVKKELTTEERYPMEPNPSTVDVSCVVKYVEEMKLITEEANSWGSIKELI